MRERECREHFPVDGGGQESGQVFNLSGQDKILVLRSLPVDRQALG